MCLEPAESSLHPNTLFKFQVNISLIPMLDLQDNFSLRSSSKGFGLLLSRLPLLSALLSFLV
jgi:hypothetical protein